MHGFFPQNEIDILLNDWSSPKVGEKPVFFVKIGEMEKLKIEWKALDLFDFIRVLFEFKYIFINIYFNSKCFHCIKRLDRRYKNVLVIIIIIIIIIKDKC